MNKETLLSEGFNEVSSMATGDAWDFDKNPVARGVYMGRQDNVGSNNSTLYHFIDDKGDAFSIWGSALLDDRFNTLQVGETVVVMYEGKVKAKNSNREYKQYAVFHKMVPGEKEKVAKAGYTPSFDKTGDGTPREDLPF